MTKTGSITTLYREELKTIGWAHVNRPDFSRRSMANQGGGDATPAHFPVLVRVVPFLRATIGRGRPKEPDEVASPRRSFLGRGVEMPGPKYATGRSGRDAAAGRSE